MTTGTLEARGRRASERSAARIVVLSGAHISRNPRVHKEASALAQAGHDVEVLGAWTEANVAALDADMAQAAAYRYTPVLDLTRQGPLAALRRRGHRVVERAARAALESVGSANPWQLGRIAAALTRTASTRQADLFIAHLESGMAAGHQLLRAGRRVTVDMEDWYSEDLLPEARKMRPIALLQRLERDLLCRGAGATCPSRAMSRALAETYDCPPPVPVYNAFDWAERAALDGRREDRREGDRPTIHWFSQTVGPGRGLEDLFAALPHLKYPVDVHLRGTPVRGFDSWITSVLDPAWRTRVTLHAQVAPRELLSRICEHDIGFAGEMLFCSSRNLTITNKILQYLLGGLAVVASDTAGQREVAEMAPGAVLLYPPSTTVALASRLDELLGSSARLQDAKQAALRSAEAVFCWERQVPTFLAVVNKALGMTAVGLGR